MLARRELLALVLIRDLAARKVAQMVLEGEGHRVVVVRDYDEVNSILQTGVKPDLLMIETGQGEWSHQAGFRRLASQVQKNCISLILAPGDIKVASDARSLGFKRILTKPIARYDVETLVHESSEMCQDPSYESNLAPRQGSPVLAKELSSWGTDNPLIESLKDNRFFLAASPSMLDIYRQVKLLADVDAPVLILGESGSGKEIVAHLIHEYSRRSRQRFLNVNCAALPTDLLESELFGHVKGAFTGAINDKPGKFELADGGTLLLDEIGEISAPMQAKLLQVLQDHEFTRLGARQSTRVNVHILAATNISVESALSEKTFREDLYYRLNTFTINVPPLRERREEIPLLVNEMVRRTSDDMKPPGFMGFSSRLTDMLSLYHWPGNLRELRNFVIRSMVMQDEDAAIADLEVRMARAKEPQPEAVVDAGSDAMGMRSVMRDVRHRAESHMIREALDTCGWNRRKAANDLGISYRALLYKIQQYGLLPGRKSA